MNKDSELLDKKQLPSIAYVDEKKDERDNFYTDAYISELFDDIHLIEPLPNLDEMLEHILTLGVDALITDFNLTEVAPLEYSGEQLVERFLQVRTGFPCFIRTSYEEDALSKSADVNRVYSKNTAKDAHHGRSLFERIDLQITKYRDSVESWQSELMKLVSIPADQRSAQDVSRLIELDHKLEIALGADDQIPKEVKEEALAKRNQLRLETEKLIAAIRQELGE